MVAVFLRAEFSEKVQAKRTFGLSLSVQPKGLKYIKNVSSYLGSS
jgi:hypothetical protein